MRPAEWHGRGVRVLGRTAVEAARDPWPSGLPRPP
jgi:hypothetical protein